MSAVVCVRCAVIAACLASSTPETSKITCRASSLRGRSSSSPNSSSQIPEPDPTKPAIDIQNDAKAVDGDKTKDQPHCNIVGSSQTAQAKRPDELTQKIIDTQQFEPRHYGSIGWQASTPGKKHDELTQKIIDSTSCSD